MSDPSLPPRRGPGRPRVEISPEEREARRQKEAARLRAYRKRRRKERAAPRARSLYPPEMDGGDQVLIERYLSARASDVAKSTLDAYRTDLIQFSLSQRSGGRSLLQVSREHVSTYARDNAREANDLVDSKPWSGRTMRRKLSALSGFYEWALDESLIERDPTRRVRGKPFHKPEPIRIPRADVKRFFDHIEFRIATSDERTGQLYLLDHAIFRFCFGTALRVSEATYLRISAARTNKDGVFGFDVVRKGGRTLFYPVAGRVADAYQAWMQLRQQIPVRVRQERDLVFVHPWTGRRLSRKRAWNRIRRLAEEAGLSAEVQARISPHKLRHAKAYFMLEDGEPINAVQSMLGHATVTSTQEYIRDDERARIAVLKRASQR